MWIELTEADVLRKLAAPELEAARTAVLDAGQADPLAEVIEEIVREVRGRVAACARNVLGEGSTIPDECQAAALARIRFELATRLPGGVLLDEDRRTANANAIAFLRDVASCDVAIVQPDTASEDQAGKSSIKFVGASKRRATRSQLKGL